MNDECSFKREYIFSTSLDYAPLFHPNLDNSVFIAHKELPSAPPPQPVVPENFLEAVEHPSSSAAKKLEESLEPLEAINQIGSGSDQKLETALSKPVQVRVQLNCYAYMFYIIAFGFVDYRV